MWAPVGDRKRGLAGLAAPSALVHGEVIPNRIDVLESLENVAREDYRAHEFRNLAVSYHESLSGGKGKHLHAGGAAVPVAGVNSLFDVRNHLF